MAIGYKPGGLHPLGGPGFEEATPYIHSATLRILPSYRHRAILGQPWRHYVHRATLRAKSEAEPYTHSVPLPIWSRYTHSAPLELRQWARYTHSAPLELRQWARYTHSAVGRALVAAEYVHSVPLPIWARYTHSAPLELRQWARYTHSAPLELRQWTRYTHSAVGRALVAAEYVHSAPLPIWSRYTHSAPLELRQWARYTHSAPIELRQWATYTHAAPVPIRPWSTYTHTAVLSLDQPWHHYIHSALLPIDTDFAAIDISVSVALIRIADGRAFELVEWEIAASEDDVHISGSFALAQPAEVALIAEGDIFDFTAGAKTWRLMVESRDLSQGENGRYTGAIRAESPTLALDLPLAVRTDWAFAQAKTLSEIAADIAGDTSLSWDRADWVVSPYRVALEANTPIEAITWIAGETRGILYTSADGQTLHMRDEFPVTVPDFAAASPDLMLTWRVDLVEISESDDLAVGIDKVRIYDAESVDQDQVEHEEDGLISDISIYLVPWRADITLRTTRGALVSVSGLSEETQLIEDEIVTIEGGAGVAQYPVWSLVSANYLSDNLGAITIAPQGREVRTAQPDYSLLQLSYYTHRLRGTATADAPGEAQFVVEEA